MLMQEKNREEEKSHASSGIRTHNLEVYTLPQYYDNLILDVF